MLKITQLISIQIALQLHQLISCCFEKYNEKIVIRYRLLYSELEYLVKVGVFT
jgi:hypothetical protein